MIRIILDDITEISDVDVIVNSCKKTLMGGGGVDGAIHAKAGGELLEACKKLNGCNTGEAKITKGYNLKVPYVIHAVGPIHHNEELAQKNNFNQEELLRSAYLNSLVLAKEYNLKRIAFSSISTGAYGYPIDKATIISLDAVTSFLTYNPDFEVTFVLYTEELYNEYIKQIKNYKTKFIAEKHDIVYEPISSILDSKILYNNMFDNNTNDSTESCVNSNFCEESKGFFRNLLKNFFKD